jgi:hypothetical protein
MPKATLGLAALLVLGSAACVDLAVTNPNDPDASRALATSGDVLSLIAGGYTRWLYMEEYYGPVMFFSVASGQHSAPYANAGMEYYARIPRQPTINSPGDANIINIRGVWYQAYRVVAAMHDGLKQVDSQVVDLGDDELAARAYARYMQGLAMGSIALLYDSGYVYDESMEPKDAKLVGYADVMTAALGYLDEAVTLASGGDFTLDASWMSHPVTSATLVQLAHSYKARFRANVARTPAERKAADWNAIIADANAGVQQDWNVDFDCNKPTFCGSDTGDGAIDYILYSGWQMQNNWVAGMADTSSNYQNWINAPLANKMPFLILTPDTRWPQGADEATQKATRGLYYVVNSGSTRIWARPDRGTWRWSYYEQRYEPFYTAAGVDWAGSIPEVRAEEMKALVAEGDYYAGRFANVATFINATRTTHGLNATDAGGTNTSCVPRMPPTHPTLGGKCGDLWEMFKWEKRLETQFAGPLRMGWYLDGRGWGDLLEGTILQLPVPYGEMQLLQQSPYNYGGVGGTFGAPVGSYGY